MDVQDLPFLSLSEAGALLRKRDLSPVELFGAIAARTELLEPAVHAYITPMLDQAEVDARAAEQEIVEGRYRGPLHGIPIAVKDNFWTRGVRTTAGSKLLEDFVPDEDSAVVARLRVAGAVITGKCNMHELAMGGTTTNAHFGATHNPWDLDRIPGGSSGGSAAAVAAGFCYAAMGTDTGGSIRNPAAYCGLAGLKPTYGRVSLHGVVPLAWSLDHAGPLARTTGDVALVMNAIAGYDARDLSSAATPVPDFAADLDRGMRGLRVGLVRRYFLDQIDAEIEQAFEAALSTLLDLGASIEDVDFPSASLTPSVYRFIARPESASFQEDFVRERPESYGEAPLRSMVQLGSLVLATDYLRAQRLRSVMREELANAMRHLDVLVMPATPSIAHPIGRPFANVDGRPIDALALTVGLTAPFDLTGTPAISVPCGFSAAGLPIGMQIVGCGWDEATVLRAAAAYEAATPWHERHPAL